jgi:hypothetical protein
MDKLKNTMHFFFCSIDLSVERSNLEEHALKHAYTITKPSEPTEEYRVNGVQPSIHPVTQSIQTKKIWATYDPEVMAVRHDEIFAPTLLIDPIGELIYLTNNIFTPLELKTLTKEAQWLESHAKSTKRGVHKSGSRMVTFGIR